MTELKLLLWCVAIVAVMMVMWRIVIPWLRLRIVLRGVRKLLIKMQKENPDDVDLKKGIRLVDEYLKEDKL